jgi:hypothetical protein
VVFGQIKDINKNRKIRLKKFYCFLPLRIPDSCLKILCSFKIKLMHSNAEFGALVSSIKNNGMVKLLFADDRGN